MYKEGVRDILDKLDYDLVGLIPVKRRVREIAALLVLDKVNQQLESFLRSATWCFDLCRLCLRVV